MAAGRRRSHRRRGRRLPGRRGRSRTARYGNGKRWLAVWLDPDGRERSKAFATKTAADDHWQAQATDVSRGDYLDANAGKVLVASLGPQWLTSRRVDPATLIRYESAYRIHVEPKFGQRRVRSIRPSEIAQFTSTLDDRYGPSTANLGLLVVGGILVRTSSSPCRRTTGSATYRCRPGSQQSQRPTPHVTHRRPTHYRGSIPTAIRSPSTSSSDGPTTCTSAPAGTTS